MSVTHKVLLSREKLSPNGKKIADWIVTDPSKVIPLTSQELAKQINVSQSSIIKFSQKLGFDGFSQFKRSLIEELSRKSAIQHTPLHTNISTSDSTSTMLQKLIKAKSEAIFQTSNALANGEFDLVVDLINKAQRVHIVGMGGSALTGKDLAYKLLKLGIAVTSEFDSHVQIGIARTLSPDDIQIVISFMGETKEINAAVEAAKERGVQVIALTSPIPSELRSLADICLDTIADELQHRASSMIARTAQNVITDALFISLVKQRGDSGQEMIQDIASHIKLLS